MDDKMIDVMFFGEQTVKRLKRHTKFLDNALPTIKDNFERKVAIQVLKGMNALLEQQLFLEKRKTQ
jgi:hypothetical protein